MGFRQTAEHRSGKGSYHQIGLVRGQFGDIPEEEWLKFIADAGFDGWEEASWELELSRCATDSGAEAYARERVEKARKYGLEIFTVAVHLQGQALGDEPSAKTLQFVGGEALEAYRRWRAAGNNPPRTDPYYVPEEVGRLIHKQALDALCNAARYAHYLGKLQDRRVCLPGFTGSPAHCWSHWFEFPPLPRSLGGFAIPDVREVSLELLVERFAPFLDVCKRYGVTFDLECHPSERAMGDLESAGDYLRAMDKAGYASVVGFNLDGSHMEWQGVSVIEFIREYGERIHCAHIKGVWVAKEHTRAGRLGGHRPMGHKFNGWNFVTAGSARDANSVEEILIELNRAGYDGAINIEWEDNDVEKRAGARYALANVRRADHPPSRTRHDETLRA
ncbi:MAG: sugar phosphate isomerase/epimerase [Gemmatales bacterium]|nr:sugar phosphate isomerase/epimerase [Gemmatales bacterium]MCS7160359.1 sugar phosphate isomerase/epimerase [Gemmatales bacterium]MDW8175559.1 sugar phosphate isomerase/epimerase [Gemmatales bacterium]MDW8221906.1 sugar phosphate isomerase/epimerase [Gemmatales bacterium]